MILDVNNHGTPAEYFSTVLAIIKEKLGSLGKFLAELKPKESELLKECYLHDFVRSTHCSSLKEEQASQEYQVILVYSKFKDVDYILILNTIIFLWFIMFDTLIAL